MWYGIIIPILSPLTRYLLDILPGKSHTLDGFVRCVKTNR